MSVMTFGFNRYELFTRRLAFQMATGERLFVSAERAEKERENTSALVIVNADEPFVSVGSAVSKYVSVGSTVLLYGERVHNELLYYTAALRIMRVFLLLFAWKRMNMLRVVKRCVTTTAICR